MTTHIRDFFQEMVDALPDYSAAVKFYSNVIVHMLNAIIEQSCL